MITDNILAHFLKIVIPEIKETGAYKNGLGKYQLRHEEMSPVFDKYHVLGLGFDAVIHHFKAPDTGDPHDHPFAFQTCILDGWYVERKFDKGGSFTDYRRETGSSHTVEAADIHQLIEMPETGCFTLMLPGPWEREPGFWKWDNHGAYFRQHNWPEFQKQ